MATYICSNCQTILKTKKDVALGSTLNCPRCKKPFVVEEEYEEDVPERTSCLSICLFIVGAALLLCCTGTGVSTWWFWHNIKGWLADMEIIARDAPKEKIEPKDRGRPGPD